MSTVATDIGFSTELTSGDGSRRDFISGAAAFGGVVLAGSMLSGCAGIPGFGLTDAIRRLLSRASTNALTALMAPGGFYDNELTRLDIPPVFGSNRAGNIVSTVLGSGVFRNRLQRQLNRAAEDGAERAAPLVADAVRVVGINAAEQIIRGGPSAATAFLRGEMGLSLVEAMVPAIGDAMRLADDQVVSEALRAVTGVDLGGIARDVSARADNAIWSAIGREEAAIRANPRATNDPVLIGVFGGLGAVGG